jgi:DnaJ-class molecular chaperone
MRDPYEVLGVAKSASAGEVKKAFRRLAKKHHPDQEQKRSHSAGEIRRGEHGLRNPRRRKEAREFDPWRNRRRGQAAPSGFDGFPGGFRRSSGGPGQAEHFEFHFGGGNPFGRGGRTRTSNIDQSDFLATCSAVSVEAQAQVPVRGRKDAPARRRAARMSPRSVEVPLVDAVKGGRSSSTCERQAPRSGDPAGIEDGQQIRLKGQGEPSILGGQPGDAIITVHIGKHPQLRVDGRDLRLDLPVTLYEAVLGAKVEAPTLDGNVELTISTLFQRRPHAAAARQGPAGRRRQAAGDLLVSLRIVLPDHGGGGGGEIENWRSVYAARRPTTRGRVDTKGSPPGFD